MKIPCQINLPEYSKRVSRFLHTVLSFEKLCFENFGISTNNILSVEVVKVLQYLHVSFSFQ